MYLAEKTVKNYVTGLLGKQLGGTFAAGAAPDGGTRARWTVPLTPSPPAADARALL